MSIILCGLFFTEDGTLEDFNVLRNIPKFDSLSNFEFIKNLSIEDYEISGILEIDKYYNLKDLIINFSENESIHLNLNLKKYQSTDFTKIIPDTTGWELIDFRE